MAGRTLRAFIALAAGLGTLGLIALGMINRSLAQRTQEPSISAFASDSQLDALLTARDWNLLGQALRAAKSSEDFTRRRAWLLTRIQAGGGLLLDFAYASDLWSLGSALKVDDPAHDPRVTVGALWLYAYEIIAIDGAKCKDSSAPGHRFDQLIGTEPYRSVFRYLKAKPVELRERVVDTAIALEKQTAPLRKEDDLICRGGLDQIEASMKAGMPTKEMPTPPGYAGKTVGVEAPPGYVPKYLPPETYEPLQEKARSTMKAALLKIVQ